MKKTWQIIVESRWWIGYSVFVFVVGISSGVMISLVNPDMSRAFFKSYGESLQKIGFTSGLGTSLLIFERNAGILIATFIFGLFGLVPTFVVFVNGMIFGMYFGFREIYSTYSIVKILFLILPHGIFEISASLIGFGLSTKTGLHWLLVKKDRKKVFLQDFSNSIRAGVYVLGLLAFAALVEGLVTPTLSCFFFKICF